MTAKPKPNRILVAVDFSDSSRCVIEHALALARTEPGAELHVMTVLEPGRDALPHSDTLEFEPKIQETREALVAAVNRVRDPACPMPPIFTYVGLGNAAREIVGLAHELRADLLVVGTKGRRGVRRLISGSVAELVVRRAPCPVLAVRELDFHADADVPVPEPPCEECEAVRARTKGAEPWCEWHRQPWPQPHVYGSSVPSVSERPGVLW